VLTQEENDFISQVGPGTPMGSLMREYWVPAMLSSELPGPDSDPVRVMLLGEQLVGFRDTSGKVGLIANLCTHRGASLFFGRNEENGIRCVYHGWKFDIEGNCVDMPNEPPESNFKNRIKATAYPCQESGGIVWTYMGTRQVPPPMPEYEGFRLPDGEWDVGAALRNCNWLQGLEGDLDTGHLYFLHMGAAKLEDATPGTPHYYQIKTRAPRYVAVDTEYGAMYGAYRPADEGFEYWRIAQFLFPFTAHIPRDRGVSHRIWVPMDDHHTMFYILDKPETDSQRIKGKRLIQPNVPLEPTNGTGWFDRFNLVQRAENDYLIDRDRQRSGSSYTGITGVFSEDHAVTETMGPVLVRALEHVGTSDVMVIRIRSRLIEAARALAEKDISPPGVDDPWVYRTRSASCVLPTGVDWLQATEEYRRAEY